MSWLTRLFYQGVKISKLQVDLAVANGKIEVLTKDLKTAQALNKNYSGVIKELQKKGKI